MRIPAKIRNLLKEHAKVRNRRDLCFLMLKLAFVYFILIESCSDFFYLITHSPGMFLFYIGERLLILAIFNFLYRKAKYFREKGISDRAVICSAILLVIIFLLNGSLLGIYYWDGPYRGRVEDADTGGPVAGACVVGMWEFRCPAPVHDLSIGFLADVRETVTDKKGRFLLPPARTLWLWPFSRIRLKDIFVFKAGYDSIPPSMYKAWTDEEEKKWHTKLKQEVWEHYDSVPNSDFGEKYHWKRTLESSRGGTYYWMLFYIDEKKCSVWKPTVIRLNKAESVKEQCKAATDSLGYLDYEAYKARKMTEALNRERERLGHACY